MSTYPNANSISGLEQLLNHLRNSFPTVVDAGTLKKLNVAPNNESYVLNTIRFLGLIDGDSKRTQSGQSAFSKEGEDFSNAFGQMVKNAYGPLFELHSDRTWNLTQDQLVSFFRGEDSSSRDVARRQANTFLKLSEFAGQRSQNGSSPAKKAPKNGQPKPMRVAQKSGARQKEMPPIDVRQTGGGGRTAEVSLGVRIEVILPQATDQAVYDAIFRSIRENLISSE